MFKFATGCLMGIGLFIFQFFHPLEYGEYIVCIFIAVATFAAGCDDIKKNK